MDNIDVSLIDWSRAQFALTAMYHWIFVPLTLGLGILMAIVETIYYKTNEDFWMRKAKFWQKLFGINFAIGVATGIILEFQFGTNWSNYSFFVGDIFGAPLAIEGILAFFMEATFIAVMFFGWGKVSKRFHLISTWLTIIGASISALWILVANAWMQYPAGMHFNPDTVRNEMADFWAVALSPVAINKFFHTVISSWIVGASFALGISAYYLLKGREKRFATQGVKISAIFGIVAVVLTVITGDGSAYQVAQKQPMKLAAMEGLYDGSHRAGISLFGILNSDKKAPMDNVDPFRFNIEVPGLLSFMSTRDMNGYVPGIKNLLSGGYTLPNGEVALSAEEKIEKGKIAITALDRYIKAKQAGDEAEASANRAILDENFNYFGYGYLSGPEDLVPPVGLTYYSFRVMVGVGFLLLLVFVLALILVRKADFQRMRWFHILAIICVPLAYIASQAGWIVAEVGRQPWTIQDILPLSAAISSLSATAVKTTFMIFLLLFTILLIAEVSIMVHAIKQGPQIDEAKLNEK